MDLGTFLDEDQGPLELAHVLGVDPEVGLERDVDLHAGRDVDERAARPDRRVERGELVVVGRDDRAEVLRTRSSCSRRAVSMSVKMTPFF